MSDSMTLEIERLEDIYDLFSGDEKEITIAVGQVNTTNEEMLSIALMVTIRANIEEGDTLVVYSEQVGTALIPFDALLQGTKKDKEEHAIRKPKYDALISLVKERRNKIIMTLEGKGYNVIRGVWMA